MLPTASVPVPLTAAPVPQAPTPAPASVPATAVVAPTQAPVMAPVPARGSRIGLLLGLLVTLLLLGFVGVAFLVARRRRHFTHVEEPNDWPTREEIVPLNRPTLPNPRLLPTTQEFRKRCATALETAGWKTQLTFRGNGGGPDIVARRLDAVLAVRCRMSRSAITGDMVDEAAVMGTLQSASITVLASDAPFSKQARDEASRYHVHLLCETELSAFVG